MATFYLNEGHRYYLSTPFTYNQINYTQEGATDETFTSLGFKKVNIDPRPDDRYYVVSAEPDDKGKWHTEERNVTQLKKDAILSAKENAAALLSESDWYVIRNIETGAAIPKSVSEYRASVRATETEYEARVHKVTTLQEFIKLGEPNWPLTEEPNEIPVSE